MTQTTLNLTLALPEIFVLGMACITLLADIFIPQKNRLLTFYLVLITLVGAFLSTLYLYNIPNGTAFYGMMVHDQVSSLLKLFIYVTSFFAFVYSRAYVKERAMHFGEYLILGLFSVLGMMVLVSANNLLVLFLGLEILSLPLYAMVALRRDSAICAEAAMKYYIIGAMATGILLYGMSILYGASGALGFSEIAKVISVTSVSHQLIYLFAIVFIITGIFFKLGAAPFHMWAPDVYEGAPTPVALFIGSAPKIAALGLVLRLLVYAMPSLAMQWQQILIIIAVLSMALGNIVAIAQTNLKRMLAYSSIAHMGYMSLGLIAVGAAGYAASLFYMLAYAIMTMAAFAIIIMLSHKGFEAEKISDFKGLNSRNPWLAFLMLIVMFSMAGIPPTVGFFAKLGVLEALVGAHLIWLAAIALVFAVIGAYYYLSVVKVMYFEEPDELTPITTTRDMRIFVTINALAVIVLGIFPTALIDLCRQAFGL